MLTLAANYGDLFQRGSLGFWPIAPASGTAPGPPLADAGLAGRGQPQEVLGKLQRVGQAGGALFEYVIIYI